MVNSGAHSIEELEDAIQALLSRACAEAGASSVTFHYYDGSHDRLILPVGYGLRSPLRFISWLPSMDRVGGRIVRGRQPLFACDAQHDSEVNGPFVISEGVVASAGFPLMDGLGQVLGVLFFNYQTYNSFDVEQKARLWETVGDFGKSLEQVLTPALKTILMKHPGLPREQVALQRILVGLVDALGDVAAAIWVPEPGVQSLMIRASSGPMGGLEVGSVLNLDQISAITTSLRTGKFTSSRVQHEPVFGEQAGRARWQEVWAFPALSDSHVLAVLSVFTIGHEGLTTRERAVVDAFAQLIAKTIENEHRLLTLISLQRVGSQLAAALADRDRLMGEIVAAAAQVMGADDVTLHQYDPVRKCFRDVRTHSYTYHAFRDSLQQPREQGGATARVRDEGIMIVEELDRVTEPEQEVTWSTYVRELGVQAYLGVCLRANDEVLGVLFFNYLHPRKFSPDEVASAEMLADYAAVALRNVDLYEREQRQVESLQVLNEIGKELTSRLRLSEPEVMALIYEQTTKLMDTRYMYIALYDTGNDTVSFGIARDAGHEVTTGQGAWAPRRAGTGATEFIIRSKRPLLFKTASEAREWYSRPENKEYLGDIPPRYGYLGVPMILGDRVLGVIALRNLESDDVYDDTDLNTLLTIASQAAIALDNANLYYSVNRALENVNSELQRRVEALTALNDVGQRLTSGLHLKPEEILELIYEQARLLTGAHDLYIARFDSETGQITFALATENGERVTVAENPGYAPRIADLSQRGKTEEVIYTRSPILHRTRQESEEWYNLPGHHVYVDRIAAAWLGVPMLLANNVLGVIAMYDWEQEYAFDGLDIEILTAMAAQAAIALENASLYYDVNQSLQKRVDELEVMRSIIATITSEGDLRKLLERVAQAARDAVGAEGATVYQYDPEYAEFYLQVRLDKQEHALPRSGGTSERIIRTRDIIFADDAQKNPVLGTSSFIRDAGVKSCMAAPLFVGQECVGILYLNFFNSFHHFSEDEKRILAIISNQAAMAIQTVGRLHDANRQKEVVLASLDTIKGCDTLDELLQAALDVSLRAIDAESGTVELADNATRELEVRATAGPTRYRKYQRVGFDVGIAGRAAFQGSMQYVSDARLDSDCAQDDGTMLSQLVAPLLVRGKLVGIIGAGHSQPEAFDVYRRRLFALMSGQIAVLIRERLRLEEAHSRRLRAELDASAACMMRAMSHTIKNYLGSARVHVDEVLKNPGLSEDLTQKLQRAADGMWRCVQITKELLQPYASEQPAEIDIHLLIQSVVQSLGPLPDINVRILIPDNFPRVIIESSRAADYFLELLANAVKAVRRLPVSDDGKPRGYITVEGCVDQERTPELLFVNNGPPIDKEHWEQIFTQFSKLPGVERSPNSYGLGLWAVRTFFRRLGGDVRVAESDCDRTSFVVKLPRNRF